MTHLRRAKLVLADDLDGHLLASRLFNSFIDVGKRAIAHLLYELERIQSLKSVRLFC